MKEFIRKRIFYLVLLLFSIILSLSYYKNIFNVADENWFNSFQNDSESLVLGKILSDKLEIRNAKKNHLGNFCLPYDLIDNNGEIVKSIINKYPTKLSLSTASVTDRNWINGISRNENILLVATDSSLKLYTGGKLVLNEGTRNITKIQKMDRGFTWIFFDGAKFKTNDLERIELIPPSKDQLELLPYTSGFGLQGLISSMLINKAGFSLASLYKINSFLLSTIIMFIGIIFYKEVSRTFGLLFVISCFLSPWLTVIAKNLYWATYSWFLPVLFGFLFTIAKGKTKRIIYALLLFLSFLVKMLMGFEYLTSIVIFSMSLAFFKIITNFDNKDLLCNSIKIFLLIFVISLLAFSFSLLVQSFYKADDFYEGLKLILYDAQKRTFGDAKNYDIVFSESLNVSYIKVIKTYLFGWGQTNFLPNVPGKLFPIILIINFCLLLFYSYYDYEIRVVLLFFCYLLLIPFSWYVLAKPHSYIHTHINFVLFYIGFIPYLIYVNFILLDKFLKTLDLAHKHIEF